MARAFRCIAVLVLCIPALVFCQQTPSSHPNTKAREVLLSTNEVLTLEQAVAAALQNNRQIRIAVLEVEKLDENVNAFRTQRLPVFHMSVLASSLLAPMSFEFEQGAFGTDYPNIGPIPAQDTEITTPRRLNAYFANTISQPLSQLYKINLGLRGQELSRDVAREELRAKQHSIRNQVTRVYYDLVQTQSALDASMRTVQFYMELDRVTDQHLLQQVVLKADSIEVKMRLAKEQLEAVRLRNTLENQQEKMNQLLGRDIRRRFRVEDRPTPTLAEVDLETAQARALEQHPELRQAQLKVKQAEYDRRAKKAEYIPDVSLSVQQFSFLGIKMLPKNVLAAGISLTWEPFDWGRKSHELAEKSRSMEQAKSALQETETQILLDVNTQFRKVQETSASLRVAQLANDAAQERLRVAKDGYRMQAVRLDRVLEMEAGVSTAGFQYQRALSDYWTARADLAKAIGED